VTHLLGISDPSTPELYGEAILIDLLVESVPSHI
jgi:hypothetical protein